MSFLELVCERRKLESKRFILRQRLTRQLMAEPTSGTEEHTAWYAELMGIDDTLMSVECSLVRVRGALKAQKVGA